MFTLLRGRLISGAGAVLALSLSVFAQDGFLLDDFEDGNHMNKIGRYWYMFSPASSGILINQTNPPELVDGGYGSSSYAIAMEFTGLSEQVTSQYVTIGIGTNLSASETVGYGEAFSDVTGFSFWAKGPEGLTFNFNLETIETAHPDSSTHVTTDVYTTAKKITPANGDQWAKYEIPISEFKQEGYGTPFTLKLTNVTKISWHLKANSNNGSLGTSRVDEGMFFVDDVSILGVFEYDDGGDDGGDDGDDPVIPTASLCANCVSAVSAAPSPSALISDFQGDHALKNSLGYYWFSYGINNAAVEPAASVTAGGKTYVSVTYESASVSPGLAPAAVIGTNFYDEGITNNFSRKYLDAAKFTGVYFEYMTSADIDYVRVDLLDKYRAETPNSGMDVYVHLPGTGGEWKSATIPFAKIYTPEHVHSSLNLKLGLLAGLQIRSEKRSAAGNIAIDNVYLYGHDQLVDPCAEVYCEGHPDIGKYCKFLDDYTLIEVGIPLNFCSIGEIVDDDYSSVSAPPAARANRPMLSVKSRTINVNADSRAVVRVRVVDIRGKTVAKFRAFGAASHSLRRLPAGSYIVEAKRQDGYRVVMPAVIR